MERSDRIGRLIRDARHARGWTQDELAERMGVEGAYISSLERDLVELPKPDRLEAIERTLGISRLEMLRTLGYLGPETDVDLMAVFRRIAYLPTGAAKKEALRSLPPVVVRALIAVSEVVHQTLLDEVLDTPQA